MHLVFLCHCYNFISVEAVLQLDIRLDYLPCNIEFKTIVNVKGSDYKNKGISITILIYIVDTLYLQYTLLLYYINNV